MQKMLPDCTQERENASKMPKNVRLRWAYYYRNPLCNAPTGSVIFSRLRRAQITVFLSFMLVYRAPLDKHKTLNVDPL